MENTTITINFENLTKEEKELLIALANKSNKDIKLSDIPNGGTFKIGDISFIKISDKDGVVTAVAKDCVHKSHFGNNNNFAESEVLDWLTLNILPKLISAVGEENILDIETDLTTLDGVKTFGKTTSKISLPTLDFYRLHTEIFDRYKLDEWWWLATAWSAYPHYESSCILCVSPSGLINDNHCNYYYGVRPLLRFVSSISVSCDE